MRRFVLPLVLTALGVLTFVGGLLLGDARNEDPTPVLAAAGDPIPIGAPRSGDAIAALAPADTPADEPPASSDGGADAGDGAAAGSDGDSGAGVRVDRSLLPVYAPITTTAGPSSDADAGDTADAEVADTTDADDGSEGDPAGTRRDDSIVDSIDDLLPVRDGEDVDGEDPLRFTDPCAGPAPGDAGPESCPEGMGGVILIGDDDLPSAPPLRIDDPWMGPAFVGAENRCPVGVDPDGTVHAVVFTNVPATLTLTLDIRGEHHEVTTESSEAERLRFTSRLLGGEVIDGFQANAVQNCVTFESLPTSLQSQDIGAGVTTYWYYPFVTGTDDLGNPITEVASACSTCEPGQLAMRVRDADGYLDQFSDAVLSPTDGGDAGDFELGSATVSRLDGGVRPRCQVGADEDFPIADRPIDGILTSSLPGSFEISVVDAGTVTPMGTFETTDDERRLHDELRADGEAPTVSGPAAVQTCFRLNDIGSAGRYYLDVTGTDAAGRTVTDRLPFTISPSMAAGLSSSTPGRPEPILVERDGVVTVLVAIDEDEESVYAMGLPRTGPEATGDSCGAIEPDVLAGANPTRYLDLSHPPFPRPTGFDGFDPFRSDDHDGTDPDERFASWQPIGVFASEGDVIDVCTWITTEPDGAFDPTVEERRMLHVRAPRHMRIGIDMTWISAATSSLIGEDHSLPIEAGRYTITAVNWPGQPSETFPSRDIPRGMRDFRDSCADAADWMRPHCEDPVPVLLDSGDDDVPEVTRLRITDTLGHTVEYLVDTPTACLVGRPGGIGSPNCSYGTPDLMYVDLPDNEGALCTSDCHGARLLQLRIRPYAGPGGPPGTHPDDESGWTLNNTGAFEAGEPLGLPFVPRADLTVSTPTPIAAAPGGRPGMELVLPFDRPVDVIVVPELLTEVAPETCSLPTSQRSTASAARQVITFTDLCFDATYQFSVTAIDPVGGGHLNLPGMVFTGRTDEYPVRSVEVWMDVSSDVMMQTDLGFDSSVRLGSTVMEPSLGVGGSCLEPHELQHPNLTRPSLPSQPLGLGDLIPFTFEIDWLDCEGRRHSVEGGRVLHLDDLLAGPITYTASGDGITVTVTVTVTPEPDVPAPPISAT